MSYQTAFWIVFWCCMGLAILWYAEVCRRIKYRRLWIEATRRINEDLPDKNRELTTALKERDEWTKTAWLANDANQKLGERFASLRRDYTNAQEQIDSLMHGDKLCKNGHRFYLGNTCPHCGGEKAGDIIATRVPQDEWRVCKVCLKPAESGDLCAECRKIEEKPPVTQPQGTRGPI